MTQHYTTQRDNHNNACGGVDRNGKPNSNVPDNVAASIGKLDSPIVAAWLPTATAQSQGGLSGHVYCARNDLKTRGTTSKHSPGNRQRTQHPKEATHLTPQHLIG